MPCVASCLSRRRLPLPKTTLPAFCPGRAPGAGARFPSALPSAGAACAAARQLPAAGGLGSKNKRPPQLLMPLPTGPSSSA